MNDSDGPLTIEQFAEKSPDIIARFDDQLRHLYVNKAVEPVTGLSTHDFVGKTNEDLGMPLELCDKWRSLFGKAIQTGEPQELDFTYPSPSGNRYYHCTAWPEVVKNGKVRTLITSARDVTNKAPFIERFLNPKENPDVARIFDAILHEISNPLAIVKASLYRIETECGKNIAAEIKHKVIEEKISTGLKNISRIESFLRQIQRLN